MAPAYIVINHPQCTIVPTTAVAGIYSRLRQIPRLDPTGPPLPVIVQCMPGNILDLKPVTQIIEQLNGGETAVNAEEFVKDVVAELETEDLSVLAHVNIFYGIISSRTVNKYIAVEWSDLDDPDSTYHTFPTFVRAFVYVLAGGNDNLRKCGLKQFVGVDLPKKSSAARFGGKPIVLSDFLASMKGLGKKGKERAKDDVSLLTVTVPDLASIGLSMRPEGIASQFDGKITAQLDVLIPVQAEDTVPASLDTDTINVTATTRAPIKRAQGGKTVPDYLVPPAYLAKVGGSVPFICRCKPYGTALLYAHKLEAMVYNGPFKLVCHLPPFVNFYLQAHGWDDRVIEIVSIAFTCEATLDGFLTTMAYKDMSMAKASFLWHTLHL